MPGQPDPATLERVASAFEGIPYDDDTFDLAFLVRAVWGDQQHVHENSRIHVPWNTFEALANLILEQREIIRQTALIQELPIDPKTGGLLE